jgi:hypothetical protein
MPYILEFLWERVFPSLAAEHELRRLEQRDTVRLEVTIAELAEKAQREYGFCETSSSASLNYS